MIWLILCAAFIWILAKFKKIELRLYYVLLALGVVAAAFVLFGIVADRQYILQTNMVNWQVLAFFGLVVGGYLFGLDWLKSRRVHNGVQVELPASQEEQTAKAIALERGARHIFLREIGGLGQSRIEKAKVLVIGAGGLGSPVLQILGAAGVGQIGVIDPDHVELSNLQRQIIHRHHNIGEKKTSSAQAAVQAQNPAVDVVTYPMAFGPENADKLVAEYDLIMDGSDSFDTRYSANEACHRAGKPLLVGALSQWEGQMSLFHTAKNTPCYACVFPKRPAPGLVPTCAEAGVFSPLPNIVGSIMAAQALKHISGAGSTLMHKLLIYDALEDELRSFKIKPQEECPICGSKL